MFSSRGTVRYEERGQGYRDVEKVGKHWCRCISDWRRVGRYCRGTSETVLNVFCDSNSSNAVVTCDIFARTILLIGEAFSHFFFRWLADRMGPKRISLRVKVGQDQLRYYLLLVGLTFWLFWRTKGSMEEQLHVVWRCVVGSEKLLFAWVWNLVSHI